MTITEYLFTAYVAKAKNPFHCDSSLVELYQFLFVEFFNFGVKLSRIILELSRKKMATYLQGPQTVTVIQEATASLPMGIVAILVLAASNSGLNRRSLRTAVLCRPVFFFFFSYQQQLQAYEFSMDSQRLFNQQSCTLCKRNERSYQMNPTGLTRVQRYYHTCHESIFYTDHTKHFSWHCISNRHRIQIQKQTQLQPLCKVYGKDTDLTGSTSKQ